ncbi:MAG: hypothetical protein ACFFBI_01275 [Promethearchaeota archaeon]
MAITKLTQGTDITSLVDSTEIRFVCPVCKSAKTLRFPQSVIVKAEGLTTMSIAKGLVCDHQFQAFVDKNFAVRGYQKVDFEFEKNLNMNPLPTSRNRIRSDKELFDNLILEGNYLEYTYNQNDSNKRQNSEKLIYQSKKLTLKEIYDEFWEFIDDDNSVFQEFIKDDIKKHKNQA